MKTLSFSNPSTAFMAAYVLMFEQKKICKLYKEQGMWIVAY